jgi:hypothetical protein
MSKEAAKTDAVALLKADHRKVDELFEKFESTKGSGPRKAMVQQICTELMVHTTIEEEILYPACKGHLEEDQLKEAYVEHDGAKVMIAELLSASPDDEYYGAKVKEEERSGDGLFAEAREGGLDMAALGDRLAARKAELLAKFKAEGLPAPTTRSFTGHKLKQGQAVELKDAA